jgi:error-prone DNA polymerase
MGTERAKSTVPYAELHCHSNFSFLDGASSPEDLAEEATRLGIDALAITDHNGFYGVVRFAEAANEIGLPTVFGSEITLDAPKSSAATPDPGGRHLLIIARNPNGYARLARTITKAQMRVKKGRPKVQLSDIEGHHNDWVILTGCGITAIHLTSNETTLLPVLQAN